MLDKFGFDKEKDAQCDESVQMTNQLSNSTTVLLNDVGIAMKTLGYALYRGNVYKKDDRAKFSFSFKCSPREFVNSLAANDNFKARLVKDMRKVIEILSDPYCEVIRPLVIEYDLIEVMRGKCFSVKARKFVQCPIKEEDIGTVSPRAYCHYDPSTPPEPRFFKQTLENSLSTEEIAMFCDAFLRLLGHHRKQHKDKVPCLVGASDSGKTSLFMPLLGIIHHSNVATITKQRVFNKAMIKEETEIIFIDEATPTTMDIDDWKTLTQGGYAAYDVKYQTAKSFINKCPMLITAQKPLKFNAHDQPAMDRRLETYVFKSLPSPQKSASSWLRKHPMDCVAWAAIMARPSGDEDEGVLESSEESTESDEEGRLTRLDKEAIRRLPLNQLLSTKKDDEKVFLVA